MRRSLIRCVNRGLSLPRLFLIFEVKRADSYPWQTEGSLPNKQSVNKANNQLAEDVDTLIAILTNIPGSNMIEMFLLF